MRVPCSIYLLVIAVAICGVSLSPAKTKKQPIFIDPAFHWDSVNTIYILPADIRIDKDKNPDKRLQEIEWAGHRFLKRKGYRTAPEQVKGQQRPRLTAIDVTEDDLREAQESWVRQLGPEDAHWVFVLALEDAKSHMTFGSTGNAIVMGTLFDKQSGKLVWRAIGIGQVGQGGLLGMAMKSAMMDEAVGTAIQDLCRMVPKKK